MSVLLVTKLRNPSTPGSLGVDGDVHHQEIDFLAETIERNVQNRKSKSDIDQTTIFWGILDVLTLTCIPVFELKRFSEKLN